MNIKRIILSFFLLIFASSVSAQEKPILTKEETVQYILNKISEVKNLWVTENDGSREYLESLDVWIKESNLCIITFRENKVSGTKTNCGDWEKKILYEFNPVHIAEITDHKIPANQAVGYLKINLISSTGKLHSVKEEVVLVTNPKRYDYNKCNFPKEIYNKRESCQSILIPYLKSDPSNFNKIKKALEHLRYVSKNQYDPFAD